MIKNFFQNFRPKNIISQKFNKEINKSPPPLPSPFEGGGMRRG